MDQVKFVEHWLWKIWIDQMFYWMFYLKHDLYKICQEKHMKHSGKNAHMKMCATIISLKTVYWYFSKIY